ncbi:Equistatin, partial [Exaiptasia diaphana]
TPAKGPNKEGCPVVLQKTTPKPSKCKEEQAKASLGVMDIFIPECKPNGQYNEVQCYTFPVTGKTQCWCVDVDSGVEQAGTRLDERQPNCLQSTTTSAPVTTPAVPPALIVCVVTVYRCCPDGVTAAKGPNNQGCPVLTTPPPVPLETSPTVPPGSANEVCVTIRFKQVWYQQLLNHAGSYYLELQKNLEKSVKQIYKIHPDFVNVHFSDARPEPNPMHPSGAKALAVFFVLSFRRLVADPLATLRDSIDEKPNLAERSVFPMTLRNLGIQLFHKIAIGDCRREIARPKGTMVTMF